MRKLAAIRANQRGERAKDQARFDRAVAELKSELEKLPPDRRDAFAQELRRAGRQGQIPALGQISKVE